MVMVMLDLKEQLEQHITYSNTEQKDNRFYVRGGGRDGDILKEKGIRSIVRHLCRPLATSAEVGSGLGV
jgi:hypothetical protein